MLSSSKFANECSSNNLNYRFKIVEDVGLKGDVLDIGITWGFNTLPLAMLNSNRKVYGLEHPDNNYYLRHVWYSEMLRSYGIKVIRCDITKDHFPLRFGSFDSVLIGEVIEHLHFSSLPFIFGQIKCVLKRGGKLIITTPNLYSLVHRFKFMLGLDLGWDLCLAPKYGGTYGHVREYSKGQLIKVFDQLGFKVERYWYWNLTYGNKFVNCVNKFIGLFNPRLRNNIVMVLVKK